MRVILAGIAGGLVMFFWGAFSHMVLPIADAGTRELPNEDAIISALKTNVGETGFYVYPGMGSAGWEEKYKSGPRGAVVYQAAGEQPFAPKQFLTELVSTLVAGVIGAFILSLIVPSVGKRVIVAGLVGLAGWVSIMISYRNWYGFPDDMVLIEGFDQVVNWLLAGLAISVVLRRGHETRE